MKNNLFLVLFILAGLTMSAQNSNTVMEGHPSPPDAGNNNGFASKGCVELGGNISYSSQNENSIHTDMFMISPYIGWFPVKGLELGINPVNLQIQTGDNITTTSWEAMFAPSYNIAIKPNVFFFIEGEIGVNYTAYQYYYATQAESQSGMGYGGRTGFKIEITKHALLNLSFQYLINTYNPSEVQVSPGYIYSSKLVVDNLIGSVGFTVAL